MEYKCILSEKGKQLIVINNYKFCVAKTLQSGKIHWRCVNKKSKCPAKLYTLASDFTKMSNCLLEHNHPSDTTIQRQSLSNSLKRKAVENMFEKPSKLLHQSLRHIDYENTNEIVTTDLELIRKNMWTARRATLPTLPTNQNGVFDALNILNPSTNKEKNFLIINDKEENIVVFSCKTNLSFLCSVSTIYMDGTFQFCTNFFKQLFTIHGYKNGHYVPLVFCLLPSKSMEVYHKLFVLLSLKCNSFFLSFAPQNIVIDFEIAIHKAVSKIWPLVNIVGCRFHLSQALFRKIQLLGLVHEYKTETEKGKHLKHFFGLQFLNPDEVGECFALELFNDFNDSKIVEFQDYLVDYYVGENALFQPSIWACASNSMMRTTNGCESFHAKFNENFYTSHPDLYRFVEILYNVQAETYIKIRTANQFTKKVRPEIKKRQLYLETMLNKRKENRITRLDFVKSVCYKYAP